MTHLGRKIASGAAWMLVMRFVVRGIGLVSTVIVARLLTPEDFGLVALGTSVYTLVEFLGSFGFGEAIIQRHDTERAHYDTAWTLNVTYGLLAASALALLAGPIAAFFSEPRLRMIIYVLAATFFVERLENTAVDGFRKELEMHKVFMLQVAEKITAFMTTVSIALIFRTYWALVAGIGVGAVAYVGMSYQLTDYRPRLSFSKFNELFSFSKWLFLNNILTYVDRKSGAVIIGKLIGSSALGFYNVAYEISTLPTAELVKPLNLALFPGYSKVKDQPQTLRGYYLKALSLISLVALPAAVGLSLTAPYVVPLLLGSQWQESIPLMQILALSGLAQAPGIVNMGVHLAKNQPQLNMAFTAAKVVLLIPLLIYAVIHWGVIGAAWVHLGVNFALLPFRLWVVKRSLALQAREMIAALWRPLLATGVMAWAVHATAGHLAGFPLGGEVIVLVAAGALVFTAVVLAAWIMAGKPESGEEYLIHQIRSALPRPMRYGQG
ncbi:MAG TPA: lipopolysaccharide biosynthesis protein [Gammaproteobacteria bacterium]|nr:lipopolysaccharide biosynthesis protein [Gammaproteobacteria bacterium]